MKASLAGLALVLSTSVAAADEHGPPHKIVHFSLATAVTDPPPKMQMRSPALLGVGAFFAVGGAVTSVVGLGVSAANTNVLSPSKDSTGPALFFTGLGVIVVGVVMILLGAERVRVDD